MNRKVYELPLCEQPYYKGEHFGVSNLSNTELLALIIRSGSRNNNSIELARELLLINNKEEGLLGLHHITMQQLMKIDGIGKVKALQILAVCELSDRISKEKGIKRMQFLSPSSIADCYMEQMRHLHHEIVMVLLFDNKHALIKEIQLSKGTVNASFTSPREIFIEALKYEAVYFIVLHNHPTGDPTPSSQDISVTKRLKQAGEMIGIELSDHIIIGNMQYISLKERGLF